MFGIPAALGAMAAGCCGVVAKSVRGVWLVGRSHCRVFFGTCNETTDGTRTFREPPRPVHFHMQTVRLSGADHMLADLRRVPPVFPSAGENARCGWVTCLPFFDVGPRTQCISGLNHAAYGLPVNASRPGSPQAHASLGSGWRPTLAGWDWIPTGFRTRFRRSHHGILSPLTGLSRHTRWCTNRN